ncbi:hypothetical protein ABID86_006509 [Methylobacterium radiotolerans]|uniref:Uncharacterized protein n=1 Tax=Methylobacterium radiotolerans TaxID=31998 RepID=A0ABV2NCM9_9HYPH|nr:hypothetical protein [Methylobacterium sp. PvP109]MCX7333450.1 hypothetical protein [Hyphomicrobiales bacterium]OXE43617.1 hypothetical protein CCS92_01925 [Methylobacterium radiotolerans]GAN46327.1 carbohydrate-selective porin OprB [Methylobacterium sp. ME121]GEM95549.1 hypothetical protein MRA01_00890 [Methylobacterium radiotolerans]
MTGRAAVLSGLSAMIRFGRSGIARFDQIVWRPHPGEICGLTPLRVAMAGTSGRPVGEPSLEIGAR